MKNCSHRYAQTANEAKCEFLHDDQWRKKGELCEVCERQWKNGVEPTETSLTPILYQIKMGDNVARPTPPSFPSVFQMAGNLMQSIATHITTGAHNVPDVVYYQRMEICEGCEFYDEETVRCKDCGCYLNIKARWASMECPQKKWAQYTHHQESPINTDGPKGCGCGG